MKGKNFLKIVNLKSGYSNNIVIRDLSFGVTKGSFTGIIGPNGSGKTTLFKTITGELSLIDGDIFLNDDCISNMPIKQKAQKIAIVTQNTDAVDIPVEDYVLMGRYPYRKKLQLFERFYWNTHECSPSFPGGGQNFHCISSNENILLVQKPFLQCISCPSDLLQYCQAKTQAAEFIAVIKHVYSAIAMKYTRITEHIRIPTTFRYIDSSSLIISNPVN